MKSADLLDIEQIALRCTDSDRALRNTVKFAVVLSCNYDEILTT